MHKLQRTQVTTANSIDNWEIQQHLGIVASHAVAGTGISSDAFASFSDFFGGRSKSYRRQLESLYRDTTDDLMRQAQARGGNWLIGLRIDLDEVSGKGTQMFMITGLATAVRATHSSAAKPTASELDDSITAEELDVSIRRRALVPRLSDPQSHLTDSDWELLHAKQVIEALPALVTQYSAVVTNGNPPSIQFRERVLHLLGVVETSVVTDALYRALSSPMAWQGAVDLIVNGGFGSLQKVAEIFRGNDTKVQRHALQTLEASQSAYSRRDLALIDELLSAIPSTFPDRSSIVEKQGVLGGPKPKWECTCGKANPLDADYCGKCLRDREGFANSEMSPRTAIARLTNLQRDLLLALYE